MSGETARQESGWTVDTLKVHYDQRFIDQDKAITKAETAADKRFELLNELRDGVATKEQFAAAEKLIDGLTSRLDKIEGNSAGVYKSWGLLLGAVAGIATIIGVILAFNN